MKKATILFLFSVIFLLTTPAVAHDWYPYQCCSDQDCHPIPCETIEEKGKSLIYNGYTFSGDMIKPSQDGQCHVCIQNEKPPHSFTHNPRPLCIFPLMGS
jgi:hypothetical protein